MQLIRNKRLLIAAILYGIAMCIGMVAATPYGSERAYAEAPEGCYEVSISSSGGTTTEVECPSTQQIIIDNENTNACYVRVPGGEFQQENCADIEVGTRNSTSPNTNPGTNRGSIGINDPNFEEEGKFQGDEFDCTADVLDSENCRIIYYLVAFINILSGLAGLVIVGSIMIAGYQYMTARDNSGQIMKAKMRIVWTLAALALFIFMYALLNFLVPGGVL